MKTINIIQSTVCSLFAFTMLLSISSCASDEGNYDYQEVNQLTISGIQDKYEVEQFSDLTITPTITGSVAFDESDYSFLWFIYKYNSKEIPDTVSYEKNLNATIAKSPSSDYALVFQATNNVTGRVDYKKVALTVVNTYSKGLAILSDVEGMAQVAFINSLDHVTENAFEAVNERPLGRGPIGIWLAGRNSNSDQLIVISTEDSVVCCNNIDFSYTMNFQDLFFFPSSPGRLENIIHGQYAFDEYAIVDGKAFKRDIYVWSDAPSTLPKFSTHLSAPGKVAPFNFFRDNITGYFYDSDNKCFLYDAYSNLDVLSSGYGNAYWDACDVGMDIVWGDVALSDDRQSHLRAIMKDDSGKSYLLWGVKGSDFDMETYDSWNFIVPGGKREISGDMARATIFAISSMDPNYIYYAYGNKITCVSVITGNVISEYTVDGGSIDCMEFDVSDTGKMYVGASNGSKSANSGSVYVLRMSTNGQLSLEKSYKNICGKIVDFETNTSEEE